MAQVTKNPDETFTVTLTPKEQKALKRWAAENALSKAKQLESAIGSLVQARIDDYRRIDGPTLAEKYDALDSTKQAQVDAILNGTI